MEDVELREPPRLSDWETFHNTIYSDSRCLLRCIHWTQLFFWGVFFVSGLSAQVNLLTNELLENQWKVKPMKQTTAKASFSYIEGISVRSAFTPCTVKLPISCSTYISSWLASQDSFFFWLGLTSVIKKNYRLCLISQNWNYDIWNLITILDYAPNLNKHIFESAITINLLNLPLS